MEYFFQNSIDDFRVNYTLVIPEGRSQLSEEEQAFIQEVNDAYDEIEHLTNQADGYDYALSASSGIIAGLIDVFFVGEWDFKTAQEKADNKIKANVVNFAKKDPTYINWCHHGNKNTGQWIPRNPDAPASAVEFLEKKYVLPGDNEWKYIGSGISPASHHLDDFCHHPTLIGMICCILVQFTGNAKYHPATGDVISLPVTVNEYGLFVSEKPLGKVFAGIINWFFIAAKTLNNQKGHLMSDMAGSMSTVKKGNDGAGIPGTVMSTLKELSSLPCFKDTSFAENLRKAYQNGIGNEDTQLDLGFLNPLFECSRKFDMRDESAVKQELKDQAIPVCINEIVVRSFYFIRRFIEQMKEKQSMMDLDWKKLLPRNNRTIVRMLTISTGALTTIDVGDALIKAAGECGSNPAVFIGKLVLRVNFVGIGRFTLAVGTDLYMEARKGRLEIAVASGEVAVTAIETKKMIRETGDIARDTEDKIRKMQPSITEVESLVDLERKNLTMIEFDAEQMSEEELIEAASEIFTAQESDFEKLKNEKWYKTLFHAITLNQDGKKYAVRGIRSLAKLQQLFMSIYGKNYRKTYEQLDKTIEAVTKNSEAIKNLYGLCVLKIQEQNGLHDLNEHGKQILALLLSKYRDKDGSIPQKVKEYNRVVLSAIGSPNLVGDLDNQQIGLLEPSKAKIVYRCFMEQCAIAGTIDSEKVWPKKIGDFEIGDNSKKEIKESVKREAEIAGMEYFIDKYKKENTDEFEADFEKCMTNLDTPADTEPEQTYEINQEVSEPDECDEDVDTSIPKTPLKLTDIVTIEKKQVYENKIIHFSSAILDCAGELEFRNCTIHYNEDSGSRIYIKEGASIKILGCTVVCHDENRHFFIASEGGSSTAAEECTIKHSIFVDCEYFIHGYFDEFLFSDNMCLDCCLNFLDVKTGQNGNISVDNSGFIYAAKPAFSSIEGPKLIPYDAAISLSHSDLDGNARILISYCTFGCIRTEDNTPCDYMDSIKLVRIDTDKNADVKIGNCSFSDIKNCIFGASFIYNCIFERCKKAISGGFSSGGAYTIEDNQFIECSNAVHNLTQGSVIKNCQFYKGKHGGYITADYNAAITIESCEFIDFDCRNSDSKSIIELASLSNKNGYTSSISKCIFKGIQIESKDIHHPNFIISVGFQEPVDAPVVCVSDCNFDNCATDNPSKELIQEDRTHYGSFNRKKTFKAISVTNCNGYNHAISLEQYKAPIDFELRQTSSDGRTFGSGEALSELSFDDYKKFRDECLSTDEAE